MLTELRLENFKSWRDTGHIRLAPLTVFFGRNSSGKTSLLQSLLMMKQTVESLDPRQVLDLGSPNSYVDLGTYRDVVWNHSPGNRIRLEFKWASANDLYLSDASPEISSNKLGFRVEIGEEPGPRSRRLGEVVVEAMDYMIGEHGNHRIGMRRSQAGGYTLAAEGRRLRRRQGRPGTLPEPVKCFGFPEAVFNAYQNVDYLADLPLFFDELMSGISYVGPLRERFHRSYQWSGSSPESVGPRGERTIAAILAARREKRKMGRWPTQGRPYRSFEENLGYWLQRLGMIDKFAVQEIAEGRDLYELKVTVSGGITQVAVTDVGFGVSQVLPVLVQVFYAPSHSPILLEQPEIHLHPAAQSELGDVLISALQDNKAQLIVETHSEHLLRRIQRRVAEELVSNDDVALYCVETVDGVSVINELTIDPYGNISNWPANFFGDEIGDLGAMTDAALARRTKSS